MITTILTAAVVLAPQDPPPNGALINRPLVVTAEQFGSLLYKIPEGPGPVQAEQFGNLVDRFSWASLFGGSQFGISSFSVGLSNVVLDPLGRAQNEVTLWGFLNFSVAEGTLGSQGESVYTANANGLPGHSWHVWLPGSEDGGVPIEEIGVVQKARDAGNTGIGEITGMDQSLNALTLHPTIEDLADTRIQNFYFTVAPGSLAAFNSRYSLSVDAATILQITWNDPTWSSPSVFKTAAELGLEPGEEGDKITALAVDEESSRVLLATASGGDKRLWAASFGGFWYQGPYLTKDTNTGERFANTVLLLEDSAIITSLCSTDPGQDEDTTIEGKLARFTTGVLANAVGRDLGLNIAVCRIFESATDRIMISLSGGPSAYGGVGGTTAVLYRDGVPIYINRRHANNARFPSTAFVDILQPPGPIMTKDPEYTTFHWLVQGPSGTTTSHYARILLHNYGGD